MRVLFVTSEVAGLYKLGGLGDVSRALPIALQKLGVNITVAMPYYEAVHLTKVRCLGQIAVDFNGRRELVFVFASTLPGSDVPLLLFRHPKLNEYHGDDMIAKFAFFSSCVARFDRWDVIHCNDWHTALIPLLLGETNKLLREPETLTSKSTRTILTIHNLMYQGTAPAAIIRTLGLPKSIFRILPTKHGDTVKLLREGLEHTDVISTVSPTYAKEILTADFGEHVNEILRRRKNDIIGIVNGIDTTVWDPKRDLPSGKPAAKEKLQRTLGLPVSKMPLIGFIGRLEVRQKGVDILIEALTHLLPDGVQAVILGTGPKKIRETLGAFAKKYPEHFTFVSKFDEKLSHMIFAGADILTVPSKFEPCGLTQMIAMRYGTIPIVRRTGGLADTVTDGKTGFVFSEYNGTALLAKLKEAIAMWEGDQPAWQRMAARAKRQDFSWAASARKYKRLYIRLIRPIRRIRPI